MMSGDQEKWKSYASSVAVLRSSCKENSSSYSSLASAVPTSLMAWTMSVLFSV